MSTATTKNVVLQVIDEMRADLGREWTVEDMARTAMFSKFHFTRVFRRLTGISPARYLSALRLQEAKRLLVTTDLSVAAISATVGYSSVGTFSTRFKSCVGLSPSEFRDGGGFTSPADGADPPPRQAGTVLHGRLLPDAYTLDASGSWRVGLYPTSVRQGRPVRHVVLDQPGPFAFAAVPDGTWYVLADSLPRVRDYLLPEHNARASVGCYGPVTVGSDTLQMSAVVRLRPISRLDPPILVAPPQPVSRSMRGMAA